MLEKEFHRFTSSSAEKYKFIPMNNSLMVFSDRKIHERDKQFWDLDRSIDRFSFSEILLWFLLFIWFFALMFSLIGVNYRIILILFPLSYIPNNFEKKMPFTIILYNSTIGSKPDSTTIFNILGVVFIVFIQALIVFLCIGIYIILQFIIKF